MVTRIVVAGSCLVLLMLGLVIATPPLIHVSAGHAQPLLKLMDLQPALPQVSPEEALQERPILFDNDGLIVGVDQTKAECLHFNTDPKPPNPLPFDCQDGGDTAQREGWYWFGVWLRNYGHYGLSRWTLKRKIDFNRVLQLLDPSGNGIFSRYTRNEGNRHYHDPFDDDYGFSADQMQPLVAAMGVWHRQDLIRKLWRQLPEDFLGKHTFNGHRINDIGKICDAIGGIQCNFDCPLTLIPQACAAVPKPDICPPASVPPACPMVPTPCGPLEPQQLCNARNAPAKAANAACGALIAANNRAAQQIHDLCEQNAAGVAQANLNQCKLAVSNANAIINRSCEATKPLSLNHCEAAKATTSALCRIGAAVTPRYRFTGDLVQPAMINLIRRSLNRDPMQVDPDDILPSELGGGGLFSRGGEAGELDLEANVAIRNYSSDKDDVSDDLDLIVELILAKIKHSSDLSDRSIKEYANGRHYSYGSYMRQYDLSCGGNLTDKGAVETRINRGIDAGWKPDRSAPLGAPRWYDRAETGGNPMLAELYAPLIAMFIVDGRMAGGQQVANPQPAQCPSLAAAPPAPAARPAPQRCPRVIVGVVHHCIL